MGTLQTQTSDLAPQFSEFSKIYDRSQRNLSEFPGREMSILAYMVDDQLAHRHDLPQSLFQAVRSIQSYVTEGLIPAMELNLMGHAACSYLLNCLERNEPWAALSLFAPKLDPHREFVTEDESQMRAIAAFSRRHKLGAIRELSGVLESIITSPKLITIFGPMYSFKSGRTVSLSSELKQHLGADNIHILISAAMKEPTIRSRSLRGEEIPAEKVTVAELEAKTAEIIARGITDESFPVAQVVLIEEATFFAGNEADTESFMACVRKLIANNISVVLAGLDTNYRGEDLPVTAAVKADPNLPQEHISCSSFSIITGNGGCIHPAELTARYNFAIGGLFDFPFPIVAPRDETAGILQYTPIPTNLHPMRNIRENDPELFAQLNQISNQDFMDVLIARKLAAEAATKGES